MSEFLSWEAAPYLKMNVVLCSNAQLHVDITIKQRQNCYAGYSQQQLTLAAKLYKLLAGAKGICYRNVWRIPDKNHPQPK